VTDPDLRATIGEDQLSRWQRAVSEHLGSVDAEQTAYTHS
jgi:hypothetical protein